ncbi:TAXI family TRAP transporter solute-binding subunit [Poseidonibacter lekithochrous]|uniref:TAXI family TRAP transporter solute-binding subunit n=1 Tax=Poseidonibacter TaxID=2321187 RepID=UPI001C087C5B|nr:MULTISPECIES: TAXI family TRAP transporter solute-binding subunit [Poseidonibacter]MBU3015669.1 TAXI family TRAP transporter solute-binding subunit [Poseidonibacter lekithochrous]MDO6828970.1 TAXI family TRAP transporter solute-binding subunit [Poseidonibacter sp. 1_MG-2023]
MKKSVLSLTLVGALSIPAMAAQFITIGTGGVTGTYYPTGGAVCRMVNKLKKETGIRCTVESTGGSVYNVNTIKAGELDFGISQSDTAYQAYNGQGKFTGKPNKDLRSVIAIYPELLAFVARKDSNINSITDMKGKKINIDVPGSGTRMTTEIVMDAFGVKDSSLDLKSELKSTEGPNMLKDKKIDGYFGMFGHPTANIKDASNSVDINIVPIDGEQIDKLVKKYPYYAKGTISGTFYKGVTTDVPSIGVKAVLVSSTALDNKAVYVVTKAILDNFEDFKKLHPAYKTITKKSLLDGLSVPQHEGAKKAFKEAGLL